jgi:hypothetical protein
MIRTFSAASVAAADPAADRDRPAPADSPVQGVLDQGRLGEFRERGQRQVRVIQSKLSGAAEFGGRAGLFSRSGANAVAIWVVMAFVLTQHSGSVPLVDDQDVFEELAAGRCRRGGSEMAYAAVRRPSKITKGCQIEQFAHAVFPVLAPSWGRSRVANWSTSRRCSAVNDGS